MSPSHVTLCFAQWLIADRQLEELGRALVTAGLSGGLVVTDGLRTALAETVEQIQEQVYSELAN